MLSQEHEIASWKKFRRLWIHLKKTIDKQTKYGGFIDSCDCYHCEKREECCKHKNHGTWKTVTMLKQFRRLWIHPRKKKATDKQTNKIWRIYWQLRLLSFWDVKGLLQTQKSQNLKNYYYANKFSNSTIAIRCQSSSNLFSYVIYYVIYLPLFEFLIN